MRKLHIQVCQILLVAAVIFPHFSPKSFAQNRRGGGPPPFTAEPYKASDIYSVGEKIGWKLTLPAGSTVKQINYSVRSGGLNVISEGTLDVSSGKAVLETSLDQPGNVLVTLTAVAPAATQPALGQPATQPQVAAGGGRRGGRGGRGGGGMPSVTVGAMVEPTKIQPALGRPGDFDSWWDAKIKELAAVPMNAKLVPGDSGNPDIELDYLVMDNVQGKHIYGQIAKPKKDGKFPAVLQLQWAGVYALQKPWVVDKAKLGYLAVNIEPHDIAGNLDPQDYTDATQGVLRDYYHQGNTDREKSYFLPMYLSDSRTVDYITQRPDWDGKTLVVMGTSMGGQQSIVTAGLRSDVVTAVSVMVPSDCDANAPKAGRAAGFPDWASQAQSTGNDKILEVSRYFDPANFASRIKCPAQVAMGFLDTTSPPAGVWAMLNQIKGPVEVVPMIHSGHQDMPVGVQKPYTDRNTVWLKAIAAGLAPPVDTSLATP